MALLHSSTAARQFPALAVQISQSLHGTAARVFRREFGDSRNRLHFALARGYAGFSDNTLITQRYRASLLSANFRSVPQFTELISSSRSLSTATENKSRAKMSPVPSVVLNNGEKMPALGLGTYLSKENEGVEALRHAIDIGYRHIDTAYFYQNEKEIGQVIKEKIAEGAVKREDLYIVTKLWNIYHDPTKVAEALQKSLKNLGLDYIDLYLMHFPVGYICNENEDLLPKDGSGKLLLSDFDYMDTYTEMEKLVKGGLVRSLGISNFNSEQTDRLLKRCEIRPVTNQIECHPGFNQKQLIKFSKERDIVITAYSPLARPDPAQKKPDFLFSPKMLAIADKYKKSASQIALRYLIEIGTVPIPKSVNKKRMEENLNVFDFKLTEDEIKIIDEFHTGERINPFNLVRAQNHKYFPFDLEF